jgi:phage gpG-like protein
MAVLGTYRQHGYFIDARTYWTGAVSLTKAEARKAVKQANLGAGNYILQVTQQSFYQQEQAGNTGKKWEQLKPATIKRRRNKDKSRIKILLDRGDLAKSLVSGGAQNVLNHSTKHVSVGTSIIYGGVHQFGYKPNNIPARPYFPDTEHIASGELRKAIQMIYYFALKKWMKAP